MTTDTETVFRARAWPVARELLRPHTIFPALFAGVCVLVVLGGAAGVLERLTSSGGATGAAIAAAAWLPIATVCMSPILGRYVLNARDGDPSAGFFGSATWGETLAFAARHGALSAAWGTIYAALMLVGALSAGASPGLGSLLVLLSASLVALFAQLPCALVAARADSVREVFSGEPWAWLFVERRRDLLLFVAVLVLAGAAFWIVYGTLLGLCAFGASVVALGAAIGGVGGSSPVGMVVIYVLAACVPCGAILVLTGRLVGAFVADDLAGESPRVIDVTPGTPDRAPPTLHAIRALSSSDLDAAIAAAEEALAARPRDAQVAAELARLHRHAGDTDRARRSGAAALALSLEVGEHALAAQLYAELVEERDSFGLGPEALEALSRVLTARGKFDDATWCARAVAWAGGSPLRAQKQLIAAADAAASAGEAAAAREIYELLLREHAETSFADYVRGRLARLAKAEQ